MTVAKSGDKVKVHYHGTLSDDSVFDSSREREPLEFVLGSGSVIPGFDAGVTGLKVGEIKKVNIPCADAYGEYSEKMIIDFDKAQFPEGVEPQIGQQLQMMTETGQPVMVTVKAVEEEIVKLDANHMLAGKDLNFELELVEIA